MNILLASASPRRKALLSKITAEFVVIPSGAEEDNSALTDACAMQNAYLKALDVARKNPSALVIGADTVIEFEDSIIGKPRDQADALAILMRLSGKTHFVTTGVAVLSLEKRIRIRFADVSTVRFLPFSEETAKEYISLVPVLDKAGAYALQDHGEMIVDSVEGDPENVIGLPVRRVKNAFAAAEALFR